jgi:hypothetical protein
MNGMNLRKPKWEQFDLVPFEKSFYNPHVNLANASHAEVCLIIFLITSFCGLPCVIAQCFLLQGCVMFLLQGCVMFLLQGCVIILYLQGFVIAQWLPCVIAQYKY